MTDAYGLFLSRRLDKWCVFGCHCCCVQCSTFFTETQKAPLYRQQQQQLFFMCLRWHPSTVRRYTVLVLWAYASMQGPHACAPSVDLTPTLNNEERNQEFMGAVLRMEPRATWCLPLPTATTTTPVLLPVARRRSLRLPPPPHNSSSLS